MPPFGRVFSHEGEIRDLPELSVSYGLSNFTEPASHASTNMPGIDRRVCLSGDQLIRQAVLLVFRDPMPSECLRLFHLSRREWSRLLYWLDVSGLALSLLDRLCELGLRDRVPQDILDHLQQAELERAGLPGRSAFKKSLLPSRLPPMVVRGLAGETISTRITRYLLQCRVICWRLHFHSVEGLRYAWGSYRWRRYRERLSS